MNTHDPQSPISKRIVVFTSDPTYSVRKGIVVIDREIDDLSWLVVVHSPKKGLRQLLRSQWLNLRRNGWRWVPYQLLDIWNRVRDRFEGPTTAGPVGAEFTVDGLTSRTNLTLLRAPDIHSQSTLALVREFAPDLGLSLAAPILRRSLFSIPKLGTLNLHKGKVPEYRGMPPAFWELWNDERSVGCTVHFVDAKLDTGNIVAESRVEREQFSSLRGLQLRLDEVGVDLVSRSVQQIFQGAAESVPQGPGGATHRKPTLAQVASLKRKLTASTRSRFAKNALAGMAVATWRIGLRHLLRPRLVVLLYHRVSDSARDNLTVGVEQFDQQMALLAKNCQVLSLDQVLALRAVPRTGKPLVAVTFDDGYHDNYSNAVPILLRHQIPAAFFVATGIIGTNGRFPHDVRRGNPTIPVMQWEQLREMHHLGFTIGSHSVSHIDCAAEAEETVRLEVAQSRDDLKRELGLAEVVFAYPYGGRQHMTPERLELVKLAGYAGCLSAYGGANVANVDRFNVVRRPIHWEFSNQALLFECLGLR